MRRRGLRMAVAGGGDFFADPAVAAVRSLVRSIANLADDEAVIQFLAGPMVGLSPDGLLAARERASADGSAHPIAKGLREADPRGGGRREGGACPGGARPCSRRAWCVLPLSTVILGAVETLDHDVAMLGQGLEGEHAYANTLKAARLADAFESTGGVGHRRVRRLARHEGADRRPRGAGLRRRRVDAGRALHDDPLGQGPRVPRRRAPDPRTRPRRSGRRTGRVEGARRAARARRASQSRAGGVAKAARASRKRRRPRAAAAAEELKRLFYVGCTRAREALIMSGRTRLTEANGDGMATWLRQALGIDGPIGAGTRSSRRAIPPSPSPRWTQDHPAVGGLPDDRARRRRGRPIARSR